MKILNTAICVLNSKYIHSSLAPWCLMAGIDKWGNGGIRAEVIEGTINQRLENILRYICDAKPSVIGFCCYIWNITATKQLVTLVKNRLPESIIVLGGPEVSYNAAQVLRDTPLVDYVISGEGEKPFTLLLNAIYDGGHADNIEGLCYRKGGEIVASPPFVSQEEPPSPYNDRYFNALGGRIAYLETSRGCPYSCAFCLSGRCGTVRYYDTERAKNELVMLAKSGAKTVKLVDRTFNANRKRAFELVDFIIRNYEKEIPKGVCFHFEIAGDILDDETIKLLCTAPAGAIQLEIGLQSYNKKTLEAINRHTDIDRLNDNIKRLIECGNIHIHVDLIAGLPYEDINSFSQSFNTAYNLKPHMLQLGFLKLLHGSPMRENRQSFPCGFSADPPYEVTETPWMTGDELVCLHHAEDALDRLYNSGRFRQTLDYVIKQSGITPFELFLKMGEDLGQKNLYGITLDDYTGLVYDYFGRFSGVKKPALRDVMVCDRLAANPNGRLPAALVVDNDEIKTALKELRKNPHIRPKKGVKRGVAVLHSQNCIVYVDYEDKNPVTGEYRLNYLHT